MSSFISQMYSAASKIATVGANLTSTSKRHAIRKVLPVHPQHLFNIILQVDSYSSFLPLCTYSRIVRTSLCKTQFDATLKVGITGLPSVEEEYTSRVEAKHHKTIDTFGNESLLWTVDAKSIQSKYLDSLKSQWRLRPATPNKPIGGTPPKLMQHVWTDVDFSIEMSISDPIVILILDQILRDVASRQVAAFEQRCLDIPFDPSLFTTDPIDTSTVSRTVK